jgi:hypothetical protein
LAGRAAHLDAGWRPDVLAETSVKYARIERERRFLVRAMPPDLDLDLGFREIRDRYIDGTNLRLRQVRGPDGAAS